MKIGMIGLGKMGQGIASRLNGRFGPITVFNRSAEKTGPLVSEGAIAVDRVTELADCDFVFSMLTDDRAIGDVFLGEERFAALLKRDAIHVSMSTVSASATRRLASAHSDNGSILVAAPVLGRPDRAKAGQLFILAAGDAAAIDRCDPLFQAIGQRVFRMGDAPQQASAAKIAMNLMVAAVVENLSECFALARKCGVDTEALLSAVTESVFAAPIYQAYAPLIARKLVPEGGSTINIFLKDVELARSLGAETDIALPTADMLHTRLKEAVAAGFGDQDSTSLAIVAEGLTPK